MKKINKLIVTLSVLTLTFNVGLFNVLAESNVEETNENYNMSTKNSKVYYKYKKVNGKKYKRLWSDYTHDWVDPYWTLA